MVWFLFLVCRGHPHRFILLRVDNDILDDRSRQGMRSKKKRERERERERGGTVLPDEDNNI
jgi:hypothetical protein